jgi:hypothetical protein
LMVFSNGIFQKESKDHLKSSNKSSRGFLYHLTNLPQMVSNIMGFCRTNHRTNHGIIWSKCSTDHHFYLMILMSYGSPWDGIWKLRKHQFQPTAPSTWSPASFRSSSRRASKEVSSYGALTLVAPVPQKNCCLLWYEWWIMVNNVG